MNREKCHFIGIGGIGMSALAEILLSRNVKVSGSDKAPNAMTDLLSKRGADIFIGHSSTHIEPKSTVIFSSSVNANNPEYKAAEDLSCKIMHRSDMLKSLMDDHLALVVTGTHGKTTWARTAGTATMRWSSGRSAGSSRKCPVIGSQPCSIYSNTQQADMTSLCR